MAGPNKITRRQFLKSSALLSLAGLAPTLSFSGNANAAGNTNLVLVTVHLHGGNDHLNTFIPYNDNLYRQARPQLAINQATVLPLDERIALHPSMGRFKEVYDAGNIAIVQGCGYPDFNRSHFRAIDIYDGADPIGFPETGWLGRTVDFTGSTEVLAGTYVGQAVPLSLLAESYSAPAIPSIAEYMYQAGGPTIDGGAQLNAILDIFNQADQGQVFYDGLLAQDRAAMDSIALVQNAASGYQSDIVYDNDAFSQNMKVAAQLINADAGVKVLATELNGFDTHSNQLATHANLLGYVSAGLNSFMADAQALGFADRVVVLLFSEFGRRVAENASAGTDHGTAAPMIVMGNAVKGGLYGEYPDLANLQDGDLRMTTDFRSVYATLLDNWLGVDSKAILGGTWASLPIF